MTDSQKEIWQAALGEIELSLSQAHFTTWFKKTSLQSIAQGSAVVRVPNAFTKEWLQNKYKKLILRALRNISNDIRDVQFTISAHTPTEQKESAPEQRSVQETITIKESFAFEEDVDKKTNLNPRYTFDSFVVAASNELAYAAAQSVVKNPGKTYNPLFIYGGVGLGKTHLLQAIGNAVVGHDNASEKILYLSAELFTEDFITSLENKNMDSFKKRYRAVDVLILDDVQSLSGREQTQHAFFNTFNDLYQNDKQIILSSDRPPKAIATIEERLRSRFEGGMIADISPPDLETRIAILRKKLEEYSDAPTIDATILERIASTIQRNVRELEGALTRIMGYAELQGRSPTLEDAQSILKSITSNPHTRTTSSTILETVANFYNVTVEELCNRSRRKGVVKPRQVAMYLLRTELDHSFPAIGENLGNRDHTTAMYAFNKIKDLKQEDDLFEQEIKTLQDQIYTNNA